MPLWILESKNPFEGHTPHTAHPNERRLKQELGH